jgi:hypothetical protein
LEQEDVVGADEGRAVTLGAPVIGAAGGELDAFCGHCRPDPAHTTHDGGRPRLDVVATFMELPRSRVLDERLH